MLVHVLAGLARVDHAPRVPGDAEDHDGDDEADDRVDDLEAEPDRDRADHDAERHERVRARVLTVGDERRACETTAGP